MRRRRLLLWGGAAMVGVASTAWWKRNEAARWVLTRAHNGDVSLSPGPDIEQVTCLLTPEQTEGPFFISSPRRSDIREDRAGLPLTLQIQIEDAESCTPMEGAVVEIWHCDAEGRYSGYPEDLSRRPLDTLLFLNGQSHVEPFNGKTYLRGAQATDPEGLLTFQTIFPGWYEPRVTHIHVKVLIAGRSELTTQLYFPDSLAREVYATHPDYVAHGVSPYHHGNDGVLGSSPDGSGLLIHPVEGADGLSGFVKLAIQRA